MLTIQTTSQEETDELNYGDTVTLEIKKAETETPEKTEKTEVSE